MTHNQSELEHAPSCAIYRKPTPSGCMWCCDCAISRLVLVKSESRQDSELPEAIERILRFNCPNGCDSRGSYPDIGSDGDWEQGQCQWCFEFGMPAREAITANFTANSEVAERERVARLDELKKLAEFEVGFIAGTTIYGRNKRSYDDRIRELTDKEKTV